MNLPACLEDAKIEGIPSSAYYIADFITPEEEKTLLSKIAAAPKPRWKFLSHRRLQTWPSDLTRDILLDSALPEWLRHPILSRLLSIPKSNSVTDVNIFTDSPHLAPNHVLINEYLPGQGIMPHKDGSAYFPVVCTVSLAASLCLDIYGSNTDGTRESHPRWRILQEPRSLLVTTGDMYTNFLHGIADVMVDENLSLATVANWALLRDPDQLSKGRNERQSRTSLTYRDVLKVSKLGSKFGLLRKK